MSQCNATDCLNTIPSQRHASKIELCEVTSRCWRALALSCSVDICFYPFTNTCRFAQFTASPPQVARGAASNVGARLNEQGLDPTHVGCDVTASNSAVHCTVFCGPRDALDNTCSKGVFKLSGLIASGDALVFELPELGEVELTSPEFELCGKAAGLYPYPTSCSRFLECHLEYPNSVNLRTCPSGRGFDVYLAKCVDMASATCFADVDNLSSRAARITTQVAEPTPEEAGIECAREGQFPVEGDCTRFINCITAGATGFKMVCPDGTLFDEGHGQCREGDVGKCSGNQGTWPWLYSLLGAAAVLPCLVAILGVVFVARNRRDSGKGGRPGRESALR